MQEARECQQGEGSAPADLISLGRVRRAQGLDGGLRLEILTDFPEHLSSIRAASLVFPGGERREVEVERVRISGEVAVIHTSAARNRTEAELLAGCELMVPRSEAWPLPEGSYYHFDLIGCEVALAASGLRVGSVAAVRDSGTTLLEVVDESTSRSMLVPFCSDICRDVDMAARRILIDPPAGLLELAGEPAVAGR